MLHAPLASGVDEHPSPIRLRTLSLGADVQSTTMALLAAYGEVGPMPDCAIFADTGWEPRFRIATTSSRISKPTPLWTPSLSTIASWQRHTVFATSRKAAVRAVLPARASLSSPERLTSQPIRSLARRSVFFVYFMAPSDGRTNFLTPDPVGGLCPARKSLILSADL